MRWPSTKMSSGMRLKMASHPDFGAYDSALAGALDALALGAAAAGADGRGVLRGLRTGVATGSGAGAGFTGSIIDVMRDPIALRREPSASDVVLTDSPPAATRTSE